MRYGIIYDVRIGILDRSKLLFTEIPYENQASTKKPIFFIDGKSTGVKVSADALNGNVTPPQQPEQEEPSAPSVPDVPASELAASIIAMGKKYIGVPYKWAGTTPKGFDCSGFTQYVYKQMGYTLKRTAAQQLTNGTSVSNLKPGDLVFFQNTYRAGISHVGIYIGNGQFIHASSSKGVTISNLSSSYYTSHYYGARRIL